MSESPLRRDTVLTPEVTIRVISDSAEFRRVEEVWDRLVMDHTENPFLLAGVVREFMDLRRSRGWDPLLLILFADEVPIGLVPLATKRRWGIRIVEFLIPVHFGPDFVVEDRFRESSIAKVARFLFEDLHCQLAHLILPAQSANLPILQTKCGESGIGLRAKRAGSGHYVLLVRGTWTEFELSRGSNFRRHFKKIARKLDQIGSWRIMRSDEFVDQHDVMKRMLRVEKQSWKENWRRQCGKETDEQLLSILRALTYISGRTRGFLWKVWFLELNGETIAYNLALQQDQAAFMVKCSFSERYRNIYPGTFLANEVIRDVFNRQNARSIDFLTALPFLRRWKPAYLGHVRVCMSRNTMLLSMMTSTYCVTALRLISNAARRLGFEILE
jgi:CelD/BcsL family acetyltransferase involved in cellulose biosynthesis